MIISGIAPAATVTETRTKLREEARSERERDGFSSRHVILDLSSEAMQRVGQDPLATTRSPQPLLFIYNDTGDFAYDDAARRYEEAQRHVQPPVEIESRTVGNNDDGAEPESILVADQFPSVVTFDGMLGS